MATAAPARPRRRRWLFALILLALLWLCLEVAAFVGYSALRGQLFSFSRLHGEQAARARIVNEASDAPKLAMQDSGGDTCIHPYLGFVGNYDTDDQLLTWSKDVAITKWGFVDQRGIVRQRAPRTVLIGLYGGSVAEFFGDDGAAELADALRRDPRFADQKVEFVRMGLGGFKQPQQLFALTYLLSLGGELDYAINLDGFNEATLGPLENAPRGVPTFFPRNWSLLAEHAPDPLQRRRIGAHTVFEAWRKDLARGFGGGPWRWSVLGNVLWDSADRWLAGKASEQLVALQAQARTDLPFHITGPGAEPGDDAARADVTAATWARCSLAMHKLCTAHGIRYYHFLQPNQYFAGSKQLTADELRTAFDQNSRYRPWVERSYPRQRHQGEELARQGVRFTDLTQLFATVAETVYIDDCCHFNPLGNRHLGRAIASAILSDLGASDAPPPPAATGLRVEPSLLRLTAPLQPVELRALAATTAGERDVTFADVTWASGDPAIATVDRWGAVTALAAGTTAITVRHGSHTVTVPVEVALPRVVDLGGAYAPRPYGKPALQADVGAGQLTLRVLGPSTADAASLPGAVSFGPAPAPRPLCGGRVFLPLTGITAEMLPASTGPLTVPLRLPPGVRSVYAQAVYKVSDDICGFAVSNGLVITP